MDSNVRPDEIPDGFSAADPTGMGGGAPGGGGGGGPGGGGGDQAQQAAAKAEQRRSVLEQALTPEAIARLGTLKLVKPEKASAVEALIANMAMSGKLSAKINEGKLIEMLEGIAAKAFNQSKGAGSGTINIQRKRYAFDSDDDDDDNDDDLY
mmetsp:Transcript_24432/g.37358  ORF Transcript_24432/g.37358 Transcript_24432/m.37358 type:complete len:152 (-) Transcript_24432:472-927(-)|eukprot:CAMPEP_0194087484 /NCGR_PEP_ID=MMETSP0149-20130528/25219_1 /TAXON_ID=122233 /ORGANISM="Chaetoceros debilis, Strain MM31A-1" /LENGTH=151 /DNA_ID=CAMNT_0038770847 /DNA_START=77 /DNA_END=532 /DNA_ORIENTATION=+